MIKKLYKQGTKDHSSYVLVINKIYMELLKLDDTKQVQLTMEGDTLIIKAYKPSKEKKNDL